MIIHLRSTYLAEFTAAVVHTGAHDGSTHNTCSVVAMFFAVVLVHTIKWNDGVKHLKATYTF